MCNNTQGGYMCRCNHGFHGDGSTCTDINECEETDDICGHKGVCTNTEGSYNCTCDENHIGGGDRNACREMTVWLFDLIDIDGNGYIDTNEQRIVREGYGLPATEEDVAAEMAKRDLNGDGVMDHEEYDFAWAQEIAASPAMAFAPYAEIFDNNDDGEINATEYFSMTRLNITLAEAEKIIKKADENQ